MFLLVVGLLGSLRSGNRFWFLMTPGGLGLSGVFVYVAVMLYRLCAFVIGESRKSGLTPTIGSPGAAFL